MAAFGGGDYQPGMGNADSGGCWRARQENRIAISGRVGHQENFKKNSEEKLEELERDRKGGNGRLETPFRKEVDFGRSTLEKEKKGRKGESRTEAEGITRRSFFLGEISEF